MAATPRIGEVIDGKYQLLDEVGRGGFGIVYRALQLGMDRNVAVKILHPVGDEVMRDKMQERFRREAKMARNLNHPNTIRQYAFGETEHGVLYLVLEFLQGQNLMEIIETGGALTDDRVQHVSKGVLKSLAEAHSQGIVHRDMKPANIMLCDIYGEKDYVKVLDFGIAKTMYGDTNLTQAGVAMGSPRYMAPELLRGENPTPATDVYATAITLGEALVGGPLFECGNSVVAAQVQLADAPLPVPEKLKHSRLWPWLSIALKKNHNERYGSAEEMLAHQATPLGTLEQMGADLGADMKTVALPALNFSAPTPDDSIEDLAEAKTMRLTATEAMRMLAERSNADENEDADNVISSAPRFPAGAEILTMDESVQTMERAKPDFLNRGVGVEKRTLEHVEESDTAEQLKRTISPFNQINMPSAESNQATGPMPAATHTAAKKPKPSSGLDTPDAVTQPSDSLPNPVASPVIVSAPTPADEEPKSSMDMPTAMVSLEEIQKEVAPDINMIVKNKDSVATAAETTDEQAGRASEKPTEMVSLDETLAAIEERRRAESGTHENVHHGDADTVARDAPFAAPKDSLLGDEAPELKEVTVSVEEGESSSSGKIKILLAAIVVLTGGALFGIYMYLNQDAGAPPSAPDPAAQNAEASPPTGEGANAPGDDAGGALAETDGGQGAPAKADGGEKAAVAAAFDVYDFKLSTKPEGASILIDDEEVGTTPAAIREKSSNLPRKMTFALSGHISKEISLTPEGFAADGKLTPVTAEAQEKNPNRAVIKVLVELDREIVEEPVVEKVIEEPKPKKRRRRTAKKSKKKKSADKPSKEDPKTKDDLKTEPEPDLFEAPKEDDGINLF